MYEDKEYLQPHTLIRLHAPHMRWHARKTLANALVAGVRFAFVFVDTVHMFATHACACACVGVCVCDVIEHVYSG